MNSVLIAVNSVLILFLLLTLIGTSQTSEKVAVANKYFRFCAYSCIAGLLLEGVCAFMEGHPDLDPWIMIINYLAYLLVNINIYFYMCFIYEVLKINEKTFPEKIRLIIICLLVLNMILETVFTFTGLLYSVEGGRIIARTLTYFTFILPLVCFELSFLQVLKIPGTFDISNKFGRTLMFVIPFAGLAIMFLFSAVRQGYVWLAIVIVIMYITLQVNIAARVNIKAKIYNELSVQDSLTGLLNRRGYQEYIDQLTGDQKIGVVFSDVNSLKFVNDTLGHEAGDQLIIKAAELLKESFPDGKLFRISGDEFVCFDENTTDENFAEKVKKLDMIIRENDRITSYGCSMGEGRNIFDIVRAAETEMYQNKTRYYIETGKERRR